MILLLALLLHPLPQSYDPHLYQWCLTNLRGGQSYCCDFAGGVVTGMGCGEPPPDVGPAPTIPPRYGD